MAGGKVASSNPAPRFFLLDPVTDATVRDRVAAALIMPPAPVEPVNKAHAVISECRRVGLKIAALSNTTSFERVDIESLFGPFDAIVESWRSGYAKPTYEAFFVVQSALSLGPNDLLHVGDDPLLDVAAAKAAGWHAICVSQRKSSQALGAAEFPTIQQLGDLLGILREISDTRQ